MIERRRALTLGLAAIFAILGAIAFVLYLYRPTTLVLAVDSATDDKPFLSALAARFASERSTVRMKIATLPNADAVRTAFENGQAGLAVIRGDLPVPAEGRVVAVLRESVLALIARPGVRIETPAQLADKRIGLVGNDVAASQIVAVLTQYAVPAEAWKPIPIDPARVRAALEAGEIDVIAVAGPTAGGPIADVAAAFAESGREPGFVRIGQAKALAQRLTGYDAVEIVQGVLGGSPPKPTETIETIGFSHYLLAHSSLNDQVVAELARRMFSSHRQLADEYPYASLLTAADVAKDATIPAHPGAAAYFNDDVRTFFDRYGDWIYILAMVVSLLASAAAGLANYIGSASRRRRTMGRRLAVLLRRASVAENNEVLARIESEANAILARSMVRVEAGTVPPDTPAAFSLSISLLHKAVSERRALLAQRVSEAPRPARVRPKRGATRRARGSAD